MNITRFKRLGRLMRDARLWKRSPVILASVTPLVFGSTPALYAQVFIGPGNPLPPGSVLPADTTYIVQNGGIIGAGSSTEPSLTSNNTFINVETGGFIDNFFTSNARGVVTLEGGSIGDIFEANNNVLDIQSGSIGLEPYFNFSNAVMSGGSIGDRLQLRNNSVLGLFGGSIGDDASVYINSTLNVSGGSVGDEWTIAGSSTLNLSGGSMGGMGIVAGVANISGGSLGSSWSSFFDGITNVSGTSASLGDDIRLEDDSTLNLAGGFVGPQFQAYNNSTVNVFGTGFQVGGVPQNLSTTGGVKVVSQFNGDILSGKLRDNLNNSSNLFELRDTFAAGQDYFQTGTTLRLIEAPDATGFDNVIYSALTDVSNLPPLESNSQLNFYAGDTLPDGYVVGEYNNPTVTDIEINMYGGTMGSNSGVFDGIKINKGERVNFNMHGGSISRMSFSGSNLNIHSGTIERLSAANELNHGDATQVNIYGGTVGDYASFASFDGRVVSINMTGGQIGNSLTVLNDSELTISGGTIGDDGDIQLNGKIILSGTGVIGDNLTLLSEKNASIPGTNQSILEVHGGTVGDNLTLERDSIVNMSGGVIGKNLTLKDNSVVNLTDGQIGDNVTLKHNSTFNFSGGFVGDDISIPNFKMEGDSVLNVFGHGFYPGVIQGNTTLDGGSGSEVNVYDSARINHDFTKNNGTVSVGDDAIVGPNFAMKIGDFTLGGNAIVDNDAHLDHVDSIISGGTIGAGLKLSSGNHTISGGSIGNGLFIRISDGVPGITPTRAPTVVIEGGQIGDNARVTSRTNCLPDCSTTQVTIQGGVIGDNFRIEGGELHLTGGTGFSNFTATGSSAIVNITADELYLNSIGNPLTTDDEGEYIERTGSLLVRFESDNTTDPMVSFDLSRFIRGSVLNLYFTPGNGGGTLIPGDLNGDGFVGIADLNLVLVNWNQNVPPGNPLADPSDDGYVGIDDLTLVLGNWNAGTPPQLPGANIPEPASAVVLVLLTTGRVGLRKHGRIAA